MKTSDVRENSFQQRSAVLSRRLAELNKHTADLLRDTACMALPHPARMTLIPASHADIAPYVIAGVEHEALLLDLFRRNVSTNDLWLALSDAGSRPFERFMNGTAQAARAGDGFNNGSAGAIFHGLRYQVVGGTLFTIDDALLEMLEQTDIDLDIPMSDVHLPFPHIYVELGTERRDARGKRLMHNAVSGMHVLEGAYVSITQRTNGERTLEVTMTGSPMGKEDVGDDAVEWIAMSCTGGRTIREALHSSYHSGVRLFDSIEPNREVTTADNAEISALENDSARRLELVVKALLYLSIPGLRKQLQEARKEADKVAARAQSGAHKRKAMRQALRSYNRILILPPVLAHDGVVGESGADVRGMKAHWRRGYFRNQRFGEALTQSRLIWLAPVMVNAAQLAELTPAPKTAHYVAGGPK